jgi:hypothetical protein
MRDRATHRLTDRPLGGRSPAVSIAAALLACGTCAYRGGQVARTVGGARLLLIVRYAIMKLHRKGKTILHGDSGHSRGFKLGSVIFLVLALLLAIFSGDALLVLAVASAIGGLTLLMPRRARQTAPRQAAVQVIARTPVSNAPERARPRVSVSRRMAVRRYPSASFVGRRPAAHRRGAGSEHPAVTDAPGQPQVIQVLQ